jgi:hypothetical protein
MAKGLILAGISRQALAVALTWHSSGRDYADVPAITAFKA